MEDLTQPRQGPPLHRHVREDESFYVLEGEYLFEVDGNQMYAGPGCAIFAPRGTAHTFMNVGTKPARLLVMVQPAGLDAFFADLAEALANAPQPELSVVAPIFEKHGLELLGPPLGARPAPAYTAV